MTQAMRSVYCYYFPETRDVVSEVTQEFPHDIYLRSVSPGLDDYHCEALEVFYESVKEQIPSLKTSFPYAYPTNGSSEGLFHALASLKGKNLPIYVIADEYEGYSAYGKNLGLEICTVPFDADFKSLPKGAVFISNPSARDGNILPNSYVNAIGDAGHDVYLDLTYVGCTKPYSFDVTHPSVKMVFISFSKPLGLYYYRAGFTFAKEDSLTLAPNKWFKNILTLRVLKEVLERYECSEYVERYQSAKDYALSKFVTSYGFHPESSEVLLLASATRDQIPEEKLSEMEQFRRKDVYRFCLTPYFLEYEEKYK